MAISDNAFQADQNENMDIVEVDVDPFASAAVDPTNEIVSDNDEFETNADDEEEDEFTSSSDIEDEEVEDINRHPEETSTIGRVTCDSSIPDLCPRALSSHYTSSSPPGHPYPYQHGTPSPPVHALPPQHGFIPSSSHHSTPSSPADVYPHDHGIKPSSSHHATPSPSGHPAHSPGVGDEHTSTSRRPPAPLRHSSARSSSSRLRSSIPQLIEEIPDFFRPPTAHAEGENPLIYLIVEHGLCSSLGTCQCPLRYMMRGVGGQPSDETFKKKSEQTSSNRKLEVGGPGTGISLHSAGSNPLDSMEKKLQRRPTWKEIFRYLHTHGHDGQSFIDQRSAKIDIGGDVPDTSIDEDAIYLEMVPEVKGRVNELGS
ncbi:hypothetical protein Syun_018773 [Stephania yunnanensis]|uniref:Uncharacterized protein n=1 Tax=Stephania yunnanensis TaxID=152371 RepID=A0AAP0IV81_9MAGN